MSKITTDQLWKSIIEDLFEEFIYYFYDDYAQQIDFKRKFEFLDKELQTIYPKSDSKNRRVDKLVKVFLKDGREEWILIHIEVQGYKDELIGERMYNSYYRIYDRYNKPVSALVIYIDDAPDFHPKEFKQNCFDSQMIFSFRT